MREDLLQSEAEKALSAGGRVATFNFQDEKYWVKQKAERGWFLRLQKGSAGSLFEREISSMKAFWALGISVPELVKETETYFITRDNGVSLEAVFRASPSNQGVLVDAINAIAKMHRAGCAHGGLHMRNMTFQKGRIGFLDLEKTIVSHASEQAQAYDIVVLVWSLISIDAHAVSYLGEIKEKYKNAGGPAWPAAEEWCQKRRWLKPASAPLRWHEARFKSDDKYLRYAAVPVVMAFFGA